MKNLARVSIAITAIALYPAVGQANAGTPLMWAGAFHLFIGNSLIGIAEGLLIALLFRRNIFFQC